MIPGTYLAIGPEWMLDVYQRRHDQCRCRPPSFLLRLFRHEQISNRPIVVVRFQIQSNAHEMEKEQRFGERPSSWPQKNRDNSTLLPDCSSRVKEQIGSKQLMLNRWHSRTQTPRYVEPYHPICRSEVNATPNYTRTWIHATQGVFKVRYCRRCSSVEEWLLLLEHVPHILQYLLCR